MENVFSQQLRRIRKHRGLTQRELGNSLGLGQTAIANYENGTRMPDVHGLNKLADALKVSVDELLGRNTPVKSHHATDIHFKTYNSPLEVDFAYEISKYTELVLNGKHIHAVNRIIEIAELGLTVRSIYLNIFEPALHQQRFAKNKVIAYQENAIIHSILSCMELLRRYIVRKAPNGKRFLSVMIGNEIHNIGLSMISDYLHIEGWEVMFYGGYSPYEKISDVIDVFAPNVIGISLTKQANISIITELVGAIKAHSPNPLILVGGRVFSYTPGLWQRIHADAYAPKELEAASILTRLTQT